MGKTDDYFLMYKEDKTFANQPKHLLLASASPRRAELLQRMGLRFEIRPTHVEEDDSGSEGPERMVLENAKLKAFTLAQQVPDALVLGSDTTVAIDAQVLSKPVDLVDARRMLHMLSGRTHTVYTAVALYWTAGNLAHVFVERSEVCFQKLDDARIETYFKLVNPLDKAGAYGIQVGRELIIDRVEGSVENVMGLPIQALETTLEELGFDFRN
jgi:septum formation protein